MKTAKLSNHPVRANGWRSWWDDAYILTKIGTAYAPPSNTTSDIATTLPIVRGASREAAPCRMVRIYFIKPSKYDTDGYVLRFWKGVLPNNTLTALAALNEQY